MIVFVLARGQFLALAALKIAVEAIDRQTQGQHRAKDQSDDDQYALDDLPGWHVIPAVGYRPAHDVVSHDDHFLTCRRRNQSNAGS
jgi:hypothetical protein